MFRIDHDLSPGGIKITIARDENSYRVVYHEVIGNPNDPASAHEKCALMIYAVQGQLDISLVHSDDLLPFLMILAWCKRGATFDALLLKHSVHAKIRTFAIWAREHQLNDYATLHTYKTAKTFGNMSVKLTLLKYRGLYWVETTTAASGPVYAKDKQSAYDFVEGVTSYMYGITRQTGFSFNADYENSIYTAVSAFKGDIPALKSFHASYIVEALSAAHDLKTIEFIKSVQVSSKPSQPDVVGFTAGAFTAEPVVIEPAQKKSKV